MSINDKAMEIVRLLTEKDMTVAFAETSFLIQTRSSTGSWMLMKMY